MSNTFSKKFKGDREPWVAVAFILSGGQVAALKAQIAGLENQLEEASV